MVSPLMLGYLACVPHYWDCGEKTEIVCIFLKGARLFRLEQLLTAFFLHVVVYVNSYELSALYELLW
jgi:hypothetical protein